MQDMETRKLMQDLDDIINDDNKCHDDKQHARSVKTQLKYAEQYGGVKKVIVGWRTRKVADFAQNRVSYTVEEAIFTEDTRGTQTHEAFIEATGAADVAMVYKFSQGDYIVIDRKTGVVLAAFDE